MDRLTASHRKTSLLRPERLVLEPRGQASGPVRSSSNFPNVQVPTSNLPGQMPDNSPGLFSRAPFHRCTPSVYSLCYIRTSVPEPIDMALRRSVIAWVERRQMTRDIGYAS